MNDPIEHQLPDDPATLATLMSAAAKKFAALPLSATTEDELVAVAETMEVARRRLDGADAGLLVEISDRGAYRKVGLFSPHQFLAQHLRVGDGEARRRRTTATAIGRFSSMTGQTLDPVRPATAAAVADGAIGGEHVRAIDEIMDAIPAAVDSDVRARAEQQLASVARELTPAGVHAAGQRLLAHLDPDGALTDDRDRRRRRGLVVMPQDRQLMSKVRALLTPQLRATLELVLAQWAAPGMNNPDDPDSPRGAATLADPAALAAAADRDTRSQAQRNHDGLLALLEAAQASTFNAGTGASLSTELVVTVTDKELAAHAGVALTATGTQLPVQDLARLAGQVQPHLAVFSHTTGQALYLGRGRRLASKAQRLMLFARDRGCTGPECSVPFARTEAHHLTEWRDGGATDIGNLGAACGKHNRSVGPQVGQWQTMLLIDGPNAGRVAWRPVAPGRPAQWRVNHLRHTELLPDQGPHAPPDPQDSRAEAYLARLLAA